MVTTDPAAPCLVHFRSYAYQILSTKTSGVCGMDREHAEDIAIKALGFIASSEELLPRFLSISGIEASQIREAAAAPGFLAGVLQFVLAHEPTLLAFCQSADISPQQVSAAARSLPFGDDRWDYQP